VSLSHFGFPGRFEYGHSCRSFQISTAGWYVFVFPTLQKYDTDRPLILTECLRQAGEIISNKLASEEVQEDKFSQLMRNKTVHLLSLFLMVYIGVEVTIGGVILLPTLLLNESLILVNQDGL
jgi:fucose permease